MVSFQYHSTGTYLAFIFALFGFMLCPVAEVSEPNQSLHDSSNSYVSFVFFYKCFEVSELIFIQLAFSRLHFETHL